MILPDGRVIGVAIAIPEPFGTELRAWRRRFDDPQAEFIPPHVTLLPPTAIDDSLLEEAEEHLGKLAAREYAFDIHLRGSGSFLPVSPVVFTAVAGGISDCERLEKGVRSGPLERELHFPYHPHVTVAHDVPEDALQRAFDELARYEARFVVDGFALFEHDGGVWRMRREFPLNPLG